MRLNLVSPPKGRTRMGDVEKAMLRKYVYGLRETGSDKRLEKPAK
jgi:hypothetical protein